MIEQDVRALLDAVRTGSTSVDAAVAKLRTLPFEDLGFAKIDHHRSLRRGFPEVIYCPGKSLAQIAQIFSRCAAAGANVLATRATVAVYDAVRERHEQAEYHELARAITLRQRVPTPSRHPVAIVSAGTSDMPVAEEARVTAEIMDQRTEAMHDVGVAGLHRILAHANQLREAGAIIVVAGMEGALPSVVAGLVDRPVIAVPTSTGYGASFGGVAALLGMLNSCASGVTVVNIDNGFGAAFAASTINRLIEQPRPASS